MMILFPDFLFFSPPSALFLSLAAWKATEWLCKFVMKYNFTFKLLFSSQLLFFCLSLFLSVFYFHLPDNKQV